MLHDADLHLAQRDRHLAGLALVLDPEALLARLARDHDAVIDSLQPLYVRYKPGTNCLVAFRAHARDVERVMYAKTYALDAVEKARTARHGTIVETPLGISRVVLEPAVTVAVFPNDDKLRALRRFADSAELRSLIREGLGKHTALVTAALRPLRYKPERRFVGRLERADMTAVLRIYTPEGFNATRICARAFASTGPLRIARLLGTLERRHARFHEWLSGRVLAEVIADGDADSQIQLAATALACLHEQPAPDLPVRTIDVECEALRRARGFLTFVCPTLDVAVQELHTRLCAALSALPRSTRPLHGDFYARQVAVDGEAASLLDLDEAAVGDPAEDVATFIGHLERDVIAGRLAADRVPAIAGTFLEAYARTAGRAPAGVTMRIATTLFKLAPHPFRDRAPDWPQQTARIIARAREILNTPVHSAGAIVAQAPARTYGPSPFIHSDSAVTDPALPTITQALDPKTMGGLLSGLPAIASRGPTVRVRRIHLLRYKPGRRCLIEYDLAIGGTFDSELAIIGKIRARGIDRRMSRVMKELWTGRFGPASEDSVRVPEPIGDIPQLAMSLQTKVGGVTAATLLHMPGSASLAARIADAMHKVHTNDHDPQRVHTIVDELRILRDKLNLVASARPRWRDRLERLLRACERSAAALPARALVLIHRDFYADQVLVDGPRLYLLDFDLCSRGEAALDAGNFIGHLLEDAVRTGHALDPLVDAAGTLKDRFLTLAGRQAEAAVDCYTTLTLARHIYLSMQFLDRQPFTETLLDLCEQRLDLSRAGRWGTSAKSPEREERL